MADEEKGLVLLRFYFGEAAGAAAPRARRRRAAARARGRSSSAYDLTPARAGAVARQASTWASNRVWNESGRFQNDSGCH